MAQNAVLAAGLAVLMASAGNTASFPQQRSTVPPPGVAGPSAEPATGFLVKYRSGADANAAAASVGRSAVSGHRGAIAALFQRHGVEAMGRPFKQRFRGLDQVLHYRFQSGRHAAGLQSVLAELRKDPSVEYAEPNVSLHASMVPNDPFYGSSGSWGQTYSDLWGLQKIRVDTAWDLSQGSGVTVAVIDSGVYSGHVDLTANMATNAGETGLDSQGRDKRTNGVDDDGDGYLDDWRGWDFVNWDNDPADVFGHGTHVAGTIAAVGNNGVGIIGVAPAARILSVRVLDGNGSGPMDGVAQGIVYAADRGARVINLSLGSSEAMETSLTLRDAVAYAHDVKGAVVVAAAGNDRLDIGNEAYGFFPAALRDVITVGATEATDAVAAFSNTGTALDLAAPGGGGADPANIYQGSRSVLSLLSSPASSAMTGSGQLIVGGPYVRQKGTSMAAPHAAGVAALVLAAHPGFTPEQVRQALRRGSDDVGPVGLDTSSGYGRLNATGALSFASPLGARLVGPVQPVKSSDPVAIVGTVGCAGPGNCGISTWILTYGSGVAPTSWQPMTSGTNASLEQPLIGNWNISSIPDGAYTLRLMATALDGTSYEDRMPLVVDSARITSPSPATTTVQGVGTVNVIGTVTPADFDHYTLRVTGVRSGLLSNPNVTLSGGGLARVIDGPLATWNTAGVAADHYSVCVRVFTTSGSSTDDCVSLLVDPTLHPGWPTSVTANSFRMPSDHLTIADLNGDGAKEVLVAYGYSVRILRHDGSSLPGWPQPVSSEMTLSPAVGDVTGDGTPKIVAGDSVGNVYVWRADGSLVAGWPRRLLNEQASVALADLDGNGILDIVLAESGYYGQGSVVAITGSGTVLPGWPRTPAPGHYAASAIGDVNGDGTPEIVVTTKTTPARIYVLRTDGTLLPGSPLIPDPAEPAGQWVFSYPALADIDGDSALDIVVGSSSSRVSVLRYDGTALTGWPQTMTGMWGLPVAFNSPAVGDMDGDGLVDIVMGGTDGPRHDHLYAWKANGNLLSGFPRGAIQYTLDMSTFFGFGSAVLADLNGDGKSEVLASSNSGGDKGFALDAIAWTGYGLPGFPRPTLGLGASPTNTVAVGDLDGDGLQEIAWLDDGARLWVWDTNAPANAAAPWPMYRHDPAHTGALPISAYRLNLTVRASIVSGQGTVYLSPSGGSCSNSLNPTQACSVLYGTGTVVTLAAVPAAGSAFVGWSGACTGTTTTCQVTISSTQSVTATFKPLNAPPVVTPGGPYAGDKGQVIQFDASASYDPEGMPVTYSWSFGDGTTGTGPRPTHVYAQGGIFTVYVSVHDPGAAWDSATVPVTISDTVPPGPITSLRVVSSTNHSVNLDWTAPADDGSSGQPVTGYSIRYSLQPIDESNFDAAPAVPFGLFGLAAPGTKQSWTVGALPPPMTYYFAVKALDRAGNQGPISNVVWTQVMGVSMFYDDFEAGLSRWTVTDPSRWILETAIAASPTHALLRVMNTLTPTGQITSGSIKLVGAVKPYLSLYRSGCPNVTKAQYSISSDGGISYSTPVDLYTPNVLFPAEADLSAYNEKTIRLRITVPAANCSGVWLDDVLVTADRIAPIAKAGGPYSGYKRQPITFDGSASIEPNGLPIVSYNWDYGDGITEVTGPRPAHVYANSGTYTARLVVSNGTASSPAAVATVTVLNHAPVANPGGPYAGVEGVPITISGAGSDADGDPLTYSWTFGDGGTATGATVNRAFGRAGGNTATLTVNDGTANSAGVTANVTVTGVAPAPVVNLSAAPVSARAVTVGWTATGDDGGLGTATSYDLRYSTATITAANWTSAMQAVNEPFPAVAGTSQSTSITGLIPDTLYYFALKVTDDSSLTSALSNVASLRTPAEHVPLNDDFEGGVGNWTLQGTPSGPGGVPLWHVTTFKSKSPTRSLYYGLESTHRYETGARNYGSAISKAISLMHVAKPHLTFATSLSKGGVETARSYVSTDDGATWIQLGNYGTSGNIWALLDVDLTPYERQSIRFKFEFDTVTTGTSGTGWFLDDVRVAGMYTNQAPLAAIAGGDGVRGQAIAFSAAGSNDPEGDPLTYAWDFGDGTSATGATPAHVYTATGTYTVSLVVNDGRDSSTPATRTVTISNQNPLANAAGPYTGVRNQAIAFSAASSSDPDGDTLTYAWDFGDGSNGSGAATSHAYATIGTFTATLTVGDGQGGSATSTAAVTISNQNPVANAAGPYTGVRNQAIAFGAASSSDPDGDTLTYAWDFGDGSNGSGAATSHAYATIGTFTATLTVGDGQGGSATSTAAVTISNQNPVANAAGPYTGVRNQAIAFGAASSSDPDGDTLTYAWDFGDGSNGSGAATSHAYATIGTFTATLTVGDGQGGSATSTAAVTISNQNPVANAAGPYTGVRNQAIAFGAASSSDPDGDTLTYAWDFGDGSNGSGAATSHAYATIGTFTATLTVGDGQGGSATSTAAVTISNQNPVANAAGPYTGVRNQAIAFGAASSSDPDGDTLTYAWDFGDGSNGSGATTSHAYATIGTFTATLTVGDGQGGSGTTTTAVTISNQSPVANAGGPYTSVRNQAIAFTSAGSSDPDQDTLAYSWSFGDGTTGTGAAPTHAYAALGVFTATLTITDGHAGSATSTSTVTINNRPPLANAGGPYTGVRSLAVAFSAVGSSDPDGDALAYAWTFGDGTTGTGASPTHAYAAAGTFTATLTVNDGRGGSATNAALVTVAAPQVTVTAPNTAANWGLGSTQAIMWTSNLGSSQSVRIDISRNGGSSWSTLVASVANTGTWNWTVAGATTTSARIRVVWTADTAVSDMSNANVTIANAFVTVTTPNTNVAWAVGSTQTIRWNHNLGAAATVKLEISRNAGSTWTVIQSAVANGNAATGSFNWTVTGATTSSARVRVTWTTNTAVKDTSDVNFRVQ